MAAASHASAAPAAASSGHYLINLCDCGVDTLWAGAKNRFPYPKMLVVDLFLEAALQAAVHCYSLDLFDAYAHARGDSSVVIREHGTERVYPDRFLKLLGTSDDDLELVTSALHELLPSWMAVFDRVVARSPGRASQIIGALAGDERFVESLSDYPAARDLPGVLRSMARCFAP
ncbi:MAG TPA: hypothetical protein VGK67_34195 [Myxococcales bacterium]